MNQTIVHDGHVAEGLAFLADACPTMGRIIPLAGPIPLRRRAAGFEGFAHIVVGQQVSVASANAIWGRMTAIFDPLTPDAVLAASDEQMIAVGLSRAKQRALRAIAAAAASGALPFDRLSELGADEAHARLTAVKGVGPWTADVYAMFCLGQADAFAAGDLALQEAARLAFRKRRRPDSVELLKLARRWSPWRSVAARVLWAYYRVEKVARGSAHDA